MCACQLIKQILPDAFLRPEVITTVDRGGWATVGRVILLMTTRLKRVNDLADDSPIIFAPPTRRSVWHIWLLRRPLLVGKPELTLNVLELHIMRSRTLNPLSFNEF